MRRRLLYALLSVALISGCSDRRPTYVVHGMVVYSDGTPVTKGSVEFEAQNQKKPITAISEISPDGTYVLGTYELRDGAIAGEHRVAVISDFVIGTGIERPEELPAAAVDSKFRDFNTSGLKFVVRPQVNNILIEIDAPPPKGNASDKTTTGS